jgi:hypothetical protein
LSATSAARLDPRTRTADLGMNARNQRLAILCGPLFALLFFVGFGVIARFIPPPDPSNSARMVAALYRQHANSIRLGMVVSMFGLVFYVPWVAAISVQLRRIEGQFSPLTYAELGLGAMLPVAFFPAMYFFETAAFRSGRPVGMIQTLNDLGWLPFTGIIYAIFLENIVIGIIVLSDKRPTPIYPRWVAYFSVATGLLYCPACLDVFSTHGSLAWNGLWSWWLSLVSFFVWLVVMTVTTLQAVSAQERGQTSAAMDGPLFDPIPEGTPSLASTDSSLALESRLEALTAELATVRRDLSQLSTPP